MLWHLKEVHHPLLKKSMITKLILKKISKTLIINIRKKPAVYGSVGFNYGTEGNDNTEQREDDDEDESEGDEEDDESSEEETYEDIFSKHFNIIESV